MGLVAPGVGSSPLEVGWLAVRLGSFLGGRLAGLVGRGLAVAACKSLAGRRLGDFAVGVGSRQRWVRLAPALSLGQAPSSDLRVNEQRGYQRVEQARVPGHR